MRVRAIWDAKIAADVEARGPMPTHIRAALRARAFAMEMRRERELQQAEELAREDRLAAMRARRASEP